MDPTGEITRLLTAHREGDAEALDRVVGLLYRELAAMARRLRPHAGGSLDTGTLLHEAYLKLAGRDLAVQDRGHFKAIAARAMRQVAVDHARARSSQKRGGRIECEEIDPELAPAFAGPPPEEILTVHALLAELSAIEPRLVQVVECRFFAGMSEVETAAALGLSIATVQRDWRRARSELSRRFSAG